MDIFNIVFPAVTLFIGAGGGWYARGRGIAGVKIDASNAEKTVTDVVNQIKAQ